MRTACGALLLLLWALELIALGSAVLVAVSAK